MCIGLRIAEWSFLLSIFFLIIEVHVLQVKRTCGVVDFFFFFFFGGGGGGGIGRLVLAPCVVEWQSVDFSMKMSNQGGIVTSI